MLENLPINISPTDRPQWHTPDVLALAQQIKQDMTQEAVSVELNGALYII